MSKQNRKSVGLFPVKVNTETRKERQTRLSTSLLQKFISLFNQFGKEQAWQKILNEPEAKSTVAVAHLHHSLAKSLQ
jgi:hypothetical protein